VTTVVAMRVPSPTRAVGIFLASAAAVFAMASPAVAAPQAPGSFTGYGFDTCSAPSQQTMNAWNLTSPFSAVGIYISGNSRYCGDGYQPNLTKQWVATNASMGWRFIPIHVGYQSPCFKNNPDSRVQKKKMSSDIGKARSQARSDANESIAALRRLGFPAGSASFLDLEWYKRTTSCDNAVLSFIDVWVETLHDAGFKSGVYSSGSAAIKAIDEAAAARRSGFSTPNYIWFAWTNGEANIDGGPYLRAGLFTPHRRLHQYDNGDTVSFGGAKVNIDWNILDVGRGSVPSAQPKPCKVTLNQADYPRLRVGDKGSLVLTLQCLLRRVGEDISMTGTFDSNTSRAIDHYRSRLGWSATNGQTTRGTWISLHSAGVRPRVLKRGSVGEPVWRLQRSLRAAGATVNLNGVYDAQTVQAVRNYRTANDLPDLQTAEAKGVWHLLHRGAKA
jgi:peptidoglycan hydrolase-like protein with peptidoglycan-binding domain